MSLLLGIGSDELFATGFFMPTWVCFLPAVVLLFAFAMKAANSPAHSASIFVDGVRIVRMDHSINRLTLSRSTSVN